MKSAHVIENDLQRQRLHELAGRMTETDLSRRLTNGLTVAAVLVHLAFWDAYCRTRLEQWELAGFKPSSVEYDPLNGAVLQLASAIPDSAALELVLSAADRVDAQVEKTSPALEAALLEGGYDRLLDRASHRAMHLEQIEAVLAAE